MWWSSTTSPTARRVVEAQPALVAVTREGDVLGREHAAGGSASAPSLLEVQAAVDEAAGQLAEAGHRLDRLRFALQVGARRAGRGDP